MWGPSFWATILGLFWVRRTVALHHSQFRPDLPVKEGSESSMDGFVPCEVLVRKEKLRSRKEKHVITNDDVADGQCFADNILRDYLDSQVGESCGEQINLDELLDFDFLWPTADLVRCRSLPSSRGWSMGLLCEYGELKGSYQALGDYRECRGTVGGLYLMQDSEYSFDV
ncbi:hypothetical protein Bca101_031710 [Brassica carinata]